MAKVEIYSSLFCPYCARAKRLLEQKGIEYREIDVVADSSKRGEMTRRAGGRTSVPQIFINDTHVGGCDELYALERQGKLDRLLQGV
jgi:glutaredoxin 3